MNSTSWATGARFYAIAFLVVFYYFFTRPTVRRRSIFRGGPSEPSGENSES